MTNEEIQEIVAKADAEYDRLKDRVHEQYDEIERLKKEIEKLKRHIEAINRWIDSKLGINELNKRELKGVDKE